jgi:hypothetical protein
MAYTTINKSTDYFNTKLYTGNGSTNAITGVGFQPDMVWIKERNGTNNHEINDVVRGVNYQIYPNLTNAQTNAANHLTTFGTDGFTVGSDGALNTNSNTYCSWNWKAGNSSGSANTDGDINSTVSANTTAGFSIVSYTGTGSNATVGHGLGSAPGWIVLKNRTTNRNWEILHHKNTASPATQQLEFITDATATVTTQWNSVMPTSSVFSIGTNDSTNKNGDSFIAYCFAEKKGFSKFGSYTGNGNADGPFIYTGFKPAFVIIKRTNSAKDWFIWDNKTAPRNVTNAYLRVNTNGAAGSYDWIDLVSNGIKIRNTSDGASGSGDTYIYMAFAENPIVGSNNIPATAR